MNDFALFVGAALESRTKSIVTAFVTRNGTADAPLVVTCLYPRKFLLPPNLSDFHRRNPSEAAMAGTPHRLYGGAILMVTAIAPAPPNIDLAELKKSDSKARL